MDDDEGPPLLVLRLVLERFVPVHDLLTRVALVCSAWRTVTLSVLESGPLVGARAVCERMAGAQLPLVTAQHDDRVFAAVLRLLRRWQPASLDSAARLPLTERELRRYCADHMERSALHGTDLECVSSVGDLVRGAYRASRAVVHELIQPRSVPHC